MIWIFPLVWTVVVTVLFVWFLFTVEGESTMGIPLVFLAWLVAVFGAWGIYGLYHLVAWLF